MRDKNQTTTAVPIASRYSCRNGRRHFALAFSVLLAAALPAVGQTTFGTNDRFSMQGDYRLRYEYNDARGDIPERHRGVLRFRLGLKFTIWENLEVGARLATGDPGNPRTTDVTIGDFLDDLQISLDRAYVEAVFGRAMVTGGKYANPFWTTELVWDNDVNPAGVAGGYRTASFGGLSAGAVGIFMILDEQTIDEDSIMWGGQIQLGTVKKSSWRADVGAAYWDYDIAGLVAADDPGDRRGNYLMPDGGNYLSDFNLLDFFVSFSYTGLGERYPVHVVADYVKNLGAAVDEDEGFGVDVNVGQAWTRGRFQYRYGYARCETDAVLGAFSNDNIPLATNYINHTLRVAFGVLDRAVFGLTVYRFKELNKRHAAPVVDGGEYSFRIRLDFMMRF